MKFSPSTKGFYLAGVHGDNMPVDVVEIADELHTELLAAQAAGSSIGVGAGGLPVAVAPTAPTPDQRAAKLLLAVDKMLNAAAKAAGYDDIRSAALRAAYSGPWREEGISFATWMDACYFRCYEVLAQFEAGVIAEPTAAELIAMMPARQEPAGAAEPA